MFIKKIFEGKTDLSVHLQFQKFSKGEFKNKALIKANHVKEKYTLFTTAEYANELVTLTAEKLGNSKTKVSGAIITTADLTGKLNFKDKKQFMGVKQYLLDGEMTGKEILDIITKFPLAFIALSFNAPEIELKIKAKAPKSAKPSTKKEGRPNPDFCKIITTNKDLVKNLLFDLDLDSFKKVEIEHTFLIKDIIFPKGEKDFAKIRELAQRKGTIIRKLIVDGKENIKEKDFIA